MTAPSAIHAEAAQPIDYPRLVSCISQLEAGNPQSPGGVLCWTLAAWKEEAGDLPFSFAQSPRISSELAAQRLRKMARRFQDMGYAPTPAVTASGWRWGFDGTLELLRHHVPLSYGLRAQNLYGDRSFVCR